MSLTRLAAIALAALPWIGVTAHAHDFWIEPSSFTPAPGSVLRVHLRVGQHFEGDLIPRRDDRIDRFEIEAPSGRAPIAGVDGVDPAGLLTIEGSGTHVLIYQSHGSRVELPADRFERYLAEEGLERVLERRAAQGTSGTVGRERFIRCAKALVVAGNPSPQVLPRSGLTLEIVPRFDLSRLRAGDPFPVTVLFRGQPLESALVSVLAKGDSLKVRRQRTDRRGEATLPSPGSGPYLVKAVWMEAAPAGSDVDWVSWWASLDFAVEGSP